MRGTIIHWDLSGGTGIISDATGQRRHFARTAWRAVEEPMAGREVDFELSSGEASDIYLLPPQAPFAAVGRSDAERQAETYGIISLVCACLAFFMGPVGLVPAVPAIIFGRRAKQQGAALRDRTGHNLGSIGLILGWIFAAISLFFILFFVVVFATVMIAAPR